VTSIFHHSRNRWLAWLAAAIVGIAAVAPLYAAPVKTPHVTAELISENAAVVPGQPATMALRLQIENGWHTYWRNPGDSGLPTTLDWKLPPGFRAGAIEWPSPKALPAGPLVNYGYDGTVLHLVKLDVPADLKPGSTVDLAARADWLVCKETCIPDGADLKLALPVAQHAVSDARWAQPIGAARAALPQPLKGGWHADARGDGQKIILTLAPPAGAPDPGEMRFFAYAEGRIEPSAPQSSTRTESGAYMLTLPVAHRLGGEFAMLDGVVTSAKGFADGETVAQAVIVDAPLTGAIAAGPKPAFDDAASNPLSVGGPTSSLTFGAAVLLALAGGIILNLMPCVFPILSLKALALTNASHDDRRASRLSGVLFAVGIVLTFVALALVLLTLRAAGEQVGWGFQLQSPAVVTALAALFFVLALNLSGVFEFGSLLPGVGGLHMRNRNADALLSGVLAVIIASPCTAPFMGAALGFALAQPTAATIAVFVALGIGMALPFVLLSWFPGWRRVLPRPGAWMTRLKQVLAFPLYATVAWLIWVIGAQVDNDAVVRLLATLVITAFALWAWRTFKSGAAKGWSVAALVAAACALVVAWPLLRADASANASSVPITSSRGDTAWQPYTPARLADLTSSGRAVFVDFTAAWCVTCQVNKRLVLNSADVREAFARKNVALVRADWTRRDPAITRALAALGRNGVPVYVLYRPGREPLLLPEVLQATLVVNALAAL
jgi:thiol:disulfide interchange protein/DsbC/DsbD-like thiol-disulfide interchange protein